MNKTVLFGSTLLLGLSRIHVTMASLSNLTLFLFLPTTWDYGDVSYLDAKSKIKTENLDRMAREGVVFTDAHSSSSVSTPTRYGILTGRYNWRSTMKQGVLNGYSKALIAPGRETMASMLHKQGYTTAGIGKWHLGWDWNNIEAGADSVDFSKPVANGPTIPGFGLLLWFLWFFGYVTLCLYRE